MNVTDRTRQPEIKTIDKVTLLKPEEIKLDNGIPLYSFHAGTQDVMKIECVFDAGTWYQQKKLTAFSTVNMLKEGTSKHTASELAEIFDSYGAFIETESEKDYSFVALYSLNKHLETLLPVLVSMLRESVFPQYELSVLLANTKQEQMVSMERVSYMARLKFAEQLYGKRHPYGQWADISDYDKVNREDLLDFHKMYYHPVNLRIVVSGRIEKGTIELINKYLGDKTWMSLEKASMRDYDILTNEEKTMLLPKDNALQSGIRIGKILFTKKHPDYFGMTILNTILGGYFGSRLMTNIREDKGYTYGINSGLVSLKHSGYMSISSEVRAEVREQAVKEIFKEINLLKNEPVTDEELSLVKNFLIGSFLRSIDGPFAIADRFIGILGFGFDFSEYYNRYLQTIKNINPEQIQSLAIKYFDENSFVQTIVGK